MKTNEIGIAQCNCSEAECMPTSGGLCLRCGGRKEEDDLGVDLDWDVEMNPEVEVEASIGSVVLVCLGLALIWIAIVIWIRSGS